MSTSENKGTVTLTVKSNRKKGDNRSFYRAGIEIPGVFTRITVPKDARAVLKAEGMVLVAEDMKPKQLEDAINRLEDIAQIQAIMDASKVKAVQAAGKERMELFGGAPVEEASPTKEELEDNRDQFIAAIKGCSSSDALKTYGADVSKWSAYPVYQKEIAAAYKARKAELDK